MVPKILTLVVLFILMTISISLLGRVQRKRKERKYEKKSVWLYALVGFLLFALLGLFALGDQDKLRNMFWLFQTLILIMAAAHVWLSYQFFDWVDPKSFLPELLLTIFIGAICAMAGIGAFWVIGALGNPESQKSILILSLAFLWFPVPFFMTKTFDLWNQIPVAIYNAWRFPSYETPEFLVEEGNYKEITVQVCRNFEIQPKPDVEINSKWPHHVRLGDFFHRFVDKYNLTHEKAPIIDLRKDKRGNEVGWLFALLPEGGGSKQLLDPETTSREGIARNDVLYAYRVRLDPSTPEPEQKKYSLTSSAKTDDLGLVFPDDDENEIDDDIIFTERN